MPKFCHNCGKEAQPLWKSCPFCETSFASLASKPAVHTPAPQATAAITPFIVERENGDDSYIDRANSLSEIFQGRRLRSLDVDIVKEQPIKETVGSVHAQATSNVAETFARPAPFANVDGDAFMKAFQKEAGTRGPGIKDGDNIA